MKKIGCLVVDDEPIARSILVTYVQRLPELTLLGECKNTSEALTALQQLPVDVMFLDIKMPGVTGTTFLRSLLKPPLVVFTTAYGEHAVEGFELNSVDYLLKPITFERFFQSVLKIRDRLERPGVAGEAPNKPSHMFIRQDIKLVRLNFEEIVYAEAERDFCSIYLTNGKRLLASMHLKLLEEVLPPERFIRVHRSYIINIAEVRALKGNSIELGQVEIPVGSNYKENLLKTLHIR